MIPSHLSSHFTSFTSDIPEFTSPNDNITANQSQPAVLPCRAAARETPAVSWYLSDGSGVRGEEIGLGENVPSVRGFQSTVTDEGDLSFSLVSRDDEGWFICEAVNSIGSIEMTVYLTVNCKYLRIIFIRIQQGNL